MPMPKNSWKLGRAVQPESMVRDVSHAALTTLTFAAGPARVFALRGRFRQIVLRVTAANVYDHASTNILVNLDYTVNMIIENVRSSPV